MDTFKSLVKIKYQIVQGYESDIAHNQSQIICKQEEEQALIAQLHDLAVPAQGGFFEFAQINALKRNYLYQIDSIHTEIHRLKQVRVHLQELYKAAFIEYEKIKYLQTLEMQKKRQKLKKLEDKQMDAVGMGVFHQNQRKRRV